MPAPRILAYQKVPFQHGEKNQINEGNIPIRGRGNYESDEAKENARLRNELRDTQDALEI